jgi:hypothetical protein
MISLDDCIALCGLTEAEVAAIAEHEHLPEMAASILAQYLLTRPHGPEKIRDMMIEDIRAASAEGNVKHAASLMAALRHFLNTHPCGKAEFSTSA